MGGLLDSLFESGAVYHGPGEELNSGYTSLDDEGNFQYGRPLDEAERSIVEAGGGAIQLWHGEMEFLLHLDPTPVSDEKELESVSMSFDDYYFWDNSERGWKASENVEKVIELSKALYDPVECLYGYADHELNEYPSEEEILSGKITHLNWAMLFPKSLAEKMGKDRILTAPVWRVEELKDGGAILVMSSNPFIGGLEGKGKLKRYLGIGRLGWLWRLSPW